LHIALYPSVIKRDAHKTDALDQFYTTTCRMMMWDGQPGSHTFQLLSKHGISPCSAKLC